MRENKQVFLSPSTCRDLSSSTCSDRVSIGNVATNVEQLTMLACRLEPLRVT